MIAPYLDERESGGAPDRAAIIPRHPDLAEDISAFFGFLAELHRLRDSRLGGSHRSLRSRAPLST